MTERDVMDIGRVMLVTTLKLAMPVLLFGLITGVIVSLFQTVTQIQEFTLTFVPKLLAVVTALAIFGPWMIGVMVQFFVHAFHQMPSVTG